MKLYAVELVIFLPADDADGAEEKLQSILSDDWDYDVKVIEELEDKK